MKESVKALLPILRSIVRLLLTVVLLFHVSTNAFSQGSKTITGNVIDSYGESLIGVSVAVKGTTVGTVTDYEGNYKLDVPVGSKVLSFSYMGMKPIDIPLEGQTQINVTMEEESLGLDEVVVIGYGVQKKSDVTGAISSVKAEDLANLSTASAASAMQGKVSGVQVINTSGAPGSASTIRIRGFSSNGISEPLYIVDGLKVPGIDYLDAGNIESIEILKDGASAAIYGAEAGNGVVLVTTKTGKKGQGKIFFNTQNSFSSLARKIKLLNAHDFITYALEANPNFAQELDMFYYNDPSSYVNNKLADTDWQDEFFSTGYKQRYTVGFQGGSDKGSLYISLNYLDHDGIITGSQDTYKRISGQLNADYKIKSWFDAGVTTSIETSKYKQVGESSVLASVNMMYLMDPLTPVEYSDGKAGLSALAKDAIAQGFEPVINPKTNNYYGTTRWIEAQNPLAIIDRFKKYKDGFQVNGTLYANITPIKDLVFTSRLGYRFNNSYDYNYEKPYWLTTGAGASNKSPYLEVSQESMLYYQWENFANYSLVINKNTFSVLAGTSFIKSKANYIASSTNELLNRQDNFLHLDYSTIDALDYVLGHTTNKAQISYFGRFALDYNNRYNLQFNFRADSYDAAYLDLEHNWGYFPSVSVGWNVTNESFMQNINRDILSSLKVRASYGKNGSISNLGGYMWASSVRSGTDADEAAYYNYYMNGKLISGMYPSTYLANPKLRWEESVQLDLGVDFSFFKSRLTFTADYFDKSTDGLLVRSTANLTTGTNFVYQNVGKVNNHGFEFDIEWKDRIDNDFKYSVKANITPLSNNVDEYKGKGVRLQDSRGVSFFEEGYPIWYLRGYKVESINPTDGSPIFKDIAGAFDENGNPAPDGVISDADRTFIGNGIPDFTYGINLSMSYKNFDFSLYGAGTQGNKILYGMSKNVINKRYNMPQFMFDERWTLENPNAKRAAPYYVSEPSYVRSDAYVFDGSYFKIKQIQLGYNVPQSLLNKIQMSALRLYVSMDDFFTFTNYPGLDPEVRVNSSESMATDLGGYPVSKSVMVGLNLTF